MQRLAGEIDINARDELSRTLLTAVSDHRYPSIIVDLTAVSFIDSVALNVIVVGYAAAQDARIDYRLTGATALFARVLHVTGLAEILHAPTLDDPSR